MKLRNSRDATKVLILLCAMCYCATWPVATQEMIRVGGTKPRRPVVLSSP